MTTAGQRAQPTIHRHHLGRYLRQARQERLLRLQDAAACIGITATTLSRIETGQAPASTRYLTDLLDAYAISDPAERGRLTALARDGQRKSWWAGCGWLLPEGAGAYLDHEAAATRIAIHATRAIPGPAQTPAYATAAARLIRPSLTDNETSILAAIQTCRTTQLQPGHHLHLIIDETALRTRVAPPQVMAAQLRHLLDIAAAPNATVQVTTIVASPPTLSTPFTLLTYADPGTSDVTCYHGPAGQIILTGRAADTRAARTTLATLIRTALPPQDSATLISNLAQHPLRPGQPPETRDPEPRPGTP